MNNSSNTSDSNIFSVVQLFWFTIAAITSWIVNHSFFWALIHGLFGPFYLVYLCLGCGGGTEAVDKALMEKWNNTSPEIEAHNPYSDTDNS